MTTQPDTKGAAEPSRDETTATEAKGKARLVASEELNAVVKAQKPRGMIGRIKAEGEGGSRPGPLPLPAPTKRGISAYTPTPVIDRWNADAAGVRAVEMDDNVITMFGMVGEDFWTGEGITAKKVTAQLRAIGNRPIEVHINSFGGDMFEGIAVYNVLREHPQEVTVKVMGIAASAASIITMAADRVEISAASFIMIHNCSVFGGGNRHDFTELAAFLAPFDQAMADVYAARTGLEVKAIAKMMDEETYLSGSQAIEKGFADALMATGKTKVDEGAKASDHAVNELRAMELQLVASGMTRSDARDRIIRIKGTPGAALEGGTPGAASAPGEPGSAEPKAGTEDWSGLTDLLATIRS